MGGLIVSDAGGEVYGGGEYKGKVQQEGKKRWEEELRGYSCYMLE